MIIIFGIMNESTQDYSSNSRNPNENIFMEVTMSVVFVAIIVFSAVVLLGV
jgi:hypothetical protein